MFARNRIARLFAFASVLITSAISTHVASAMSPMPIQSAELTRFEFDPGFPMANLIHRGRVDVNRGRRVIGLTFVRENNCPPNALCFGGPGAMNRGIVNLGGAFTIELPIVSSTFDACGVETIIATIDRRPVDGALETIGVKDFSRSHCAGNHAFADTEVVYLTSVVNRAVGGEIRHRSTFQAARLVSHL